MNARTLFMRFSVAAVLALSAPYALANTAEEFDKALAEAKTAQKAAKDVNNQWFYKKDLIVQAEEAAAKGDYETAVKLAKKAKFQGDMAVTQAEEQKNAGPYPKR